MTNQSTLFAADFHASLLVLQGSAEAQKMTAISGQRCLALSKSTSPLGLLLKMLLESKAWGSRLGFLSWKAESLIETRTTTFSRRYIHKKSECYSTQSVKTLKQSVTRSHRFLYQLALSKPRTKEKDYGLFPTPTASRGNYYGAGNLKLQGWVKMFPTPISSDYKNRGNMNTPSVQRRIQKGKQITLSMNVDGSLNPDWVEVLMGYPVGWTDTLMNNGKTERQEQQPDLKGAPTN